MPDVSKDRGAGPTRDKHGGEGEPFRLFAIILTHSQKRGATI